GDDDERLRHEPRLVEAFDDGQPVGGGLAGAGGRLRDHVTAGQERGNGPLLHGGGDLEALVAYDGKRCGRQSEVREGGHHPEATGSADRTGWLGGLDLSSSQAWQR